MSAGVLKLALLICPQAQCSTYFCPQARARVVLPDSASLERALEQIRRMQLPRLVGVGREGKPCKPAAVLLREWNGYQKKREKRASGRPSF
jgi:hypothetical protein